MNARRRSLILETVVLEKSFPFSLTKLWRNTRHTRQKKILELNSIHKKTVDNVIYVSFSVILYRNLVDNSAIITILNMLKIFSNI